MTAEQSINQKSRIETRKQNKVFTNKQQRISELPGMLSAKINLVVVKIIATGVSILNKKGAENGWDVTHTELLGARVEYNYVTDSCQ